LLPANHQRREKIVADEAEAAARIAGVDKKFLKINRLYLLVWPLL